MFCVCELGEFAQCDRITFFSMGTLNTGGGGKNRGIGPISVSPRLYGIQYMHAHTHTIRESYMIYVELYTCHCHSLITMRQLHLLGHIARTDPSQDHPRALRAPINRLPPDWQRTRSRPRQPDFVCLSSISNKLYTANSIWKRA